MKVLNVNATLDPVSGGGTAERTLQMSRFLARAGVRCRVLTLDIGLHGDPMHALSGVEVVRLKCLSRRFYLFPVRDPRIPEAVRWADVIHLMGHWTLINATVYLEGRKQAKPYVFCPAGALPIFGRSRLLKALYNGLIGRRIVHGASACVAIGTNEREHFLQYGIRPDRITLIPNGVDPGDFEAGDPRDFRSRFGLGDAPFVLFVGRLNLIKGPDLLLRAFGRIAHLFPEAHLVFAGADDGMLASLREMTRQLRLDSRVHFPGHVSGPDKVGAYRAARLLVVPSRQEAMSIVVLEAGICRTPVLITDQCGFDQVEEAGGGKVVPATVDGLESGLARMLADVEWLSTMGARLESYTRMHFLWQATAARYLDLFNRFVPDAKTAI
ncbi:MAG TPA: glycosyltransferase [Burkholderiales bacterium]|nr:glycosyltransferase [Burkholderiales bacterium]